MSPTLINTLCLSSPECLPIIHIDGIVYAVTVDFASLDQVYKIVRKRDIRWVFLPVMMDTTKGSKAYGMISYTNLYIFPPLPVMIEKLIFDRAYTRLRVVTNM